MRRTLVAAASIDWSNASPSSPTPSFGARALQTERASEIASF
jgi:hypothetical protein